MVKNVKKRCLDEHLFRQAMDGVVPLRTPATTDSKVPRVPFQQRRTNAASPDTTRANSILLTGHTQAGTNDGSTFRKNGVQKRVMQKLKRGHYPIGDQLDMHHMTTNTGQRVLLEFIANAQRRTIECVRVIHGKGLRSENGPKLKTMTQRVLREHSQVLAFSECKPAEGGSGALNVLLKSK